MRHSAGIVLSAGIVTEVFSPVDSMRWSQSDIEAPVPAEEGKKDASPPKAPKYLLSSQEVDSTTCEATYRGMDTFGSASCTSHTACSRCGVPMTPSGIDKSYFPLA